MATTSSNNTILIWKDFEDREELEIIHESIQPWEQIEEGGNPPEKVLEDSRTEPDQKDC